MLNRARGTADAELRINASFLFESEYSRPMDSHDARWRDAPVLDLGLGIKVTSRRLLADTRGHVRIEVAFEGNAHGEQPLVALLDQLLAVPVDIPRVTGTELVLAGTEFARLYLQESAKTADPSPAELVDELVSEGNGSPFLVVLHDGGPPDDLDAIWLEPAPYEFPKVSFSLMQLVGYQLGVWQIWDACHNADWQPHVRALCRMVCYLSEVTSLAVLHDRQPSPPCKFDIAATDRFVRARFGVLKRKSYDIWSAPAVAAFADKHIRISLDQAAHYMDALLQGMRRDIAGDMRSTLHDIQARSLGQATPINAPGQGVEMKYGDRENLAALLCREAMNAGDPTQYFKGLVQQAELKLEFRGQALALLSGTAEQMARSLIEWAAGKGSNPANPRYAVLGSLLVPEMAKLGVEQNSLVAATVVAYRLVRDDALRADLRRRFCVPAPPAMVSERATGYGPEIDWHGPDELDLQSWFAPEPDYLDVGFLNRAVQQSRSVCRVLVDSIGAYGTGVLIAPDLVLTNYHVLVPQDGGLTLEQVAADTTFAFGVYSAQAKEKEQGFRTASEPVVAYSPTDELDFVLLRVVENVKFAEGVAPTPINSVVPALKSSMTILQHPNGGDMQLAIDKNAVTFADPTTGIVQYLTRAASGSSGSPCYDADWRLVALHRAERARTIGSVREGILMHCIAERIAPFLEGGTAG